MLNCVRATHGLLANRAPVYRGVSLPGPTGVPTDTQAEWYQGQSANPLAAATAETDATAATAACVCACDQHTLDKLSQSHLLGQMYVDVDFDRFGLYCDAPHIFNCTRAGVQRLRSVQIVTFASRPATNLLYMNGSFSTISAAVHVLTSWTFCIYNLELLAQVRLLAFATSTFTTRS